MERVRFYVGTVKARVTDWIPGKGTGERDSTEGERRHARYGFGPALVSERNWDAVEVVLLGEFPGWTQFPARGSWRGETEDSRVYEVLTEGVPSQIRLNELAQEIAHAAGQEAVLVTREEVRAQTVYTRRES